MRPFPILGAVSASTRIFIWAEMRDAKLPTSQRLDVFDVRLSFLKPKRFSSAQGSPTENVIAGNQLIKFRLRLPL